MLRARWKYSIVFTPTNSRSPPSFCTQLGIIYRDIKLENILLDANGHIVITDFGLSKELNNENNGRAYSFCGTIEYMAPEVVRGGSAGHDIAVDWWSVGVLTYELLTGASPFTKEGERNNQRDISRRILREPPPLPAHLGPDVKDFIMKLLIKDPKKRLGGGRNDASEIKAHSFFRDIEWDRLTKKLLRAPFKPLIKDELDTSNFSDEFTRLPIADSPAAVPPNSHRLFKSMLDVFFRAFKNIHSYSSLSDYSFVAPSVLTPRNVAAELLHPTDHLRPNPLDVFYNKDPVSSSKLYSQFSGSPNNVIVMVCRRCSTRPSSSSTNWSRRSRWVTALTRSVCDAWTRPRGNGTPSRSLTPSTTSLRK